MKIVIIGNLGTSMNETSDAVHMTNILRKFGHEVFDYNGYDIEYILSGEGWTNGYGRLFPPLPKDADYTILFKGAVIDDKTVLELKKLSGCRKIIYWNPDLMENCGKDQNRDPMAYVNSHTMMAKSCDIYLSKEMGWRKSYEDAGVNFIYFPTNLAPSYIYNREWVRNNDQNFLYLNGLYDDTYPVVFTGTFTDIGENRPIFLKQLDDLRDDFHIFSYNSDCFQERGFKHTHGGIWDDNYKYLICKSKINIALDWRTDIEGYWSDRINQIQACGGFVLAKYVKGMEREFGWDGHSIAYWKDLDDLNTKIDYWLEHDDYRSQVCQRAFERTSVYNIGEARILEMITILENQ